MAQQLPKAEQLENSFFAKMLACLSQKQTGTDIYQTKVQHGREDFVYS